jgi:carbonic anhydrase
MTSILDDGMLSRRRFIATAVGCAVGVTLAAPTVRAGEEPDDGTPGDALRRLREGNGRFVDGKVLEPHRDDARLAAVAAKQAPFAAILGCADSRVPPEILFDAGVGDLFVVRVAGNVATPEEVASLEFGTLVLGARAIVVLGHTRCGAVDAALAGKPVPGQISVLFQHIAPGLDRAHPDLDAAVEANARAQQRKLLAGSPVIADLSERGTLAVAAAVYDLATGAVRMLA